MPERREVMRTIGLTGGTPTGIENARAAFRQYADARGAEIALLNERIKNDAMTIKALAKRADQAHAALRLHQQ